MKLIPIVPPLSDNTRPAAATTIVLHATAGGTARSSVDWLRSQGLAYHYIIARDGHDTSSSAKADASDAAVYELADPQHWVSHVGSHVPLPGGFRANRIGVGVSLANRQDGEAYTANQIAAMHAVIALIKSRHPTVTHLTTHAVIQPWNRSDPRGIDGRAVAAQNGLQWFEPTAAMIAAFAPPKTKKPQKVA